MDFSFDDPTGDYSNFAAALKAAKEAFPSDGEYEDSDYDSDDSDDGTLQLGTREHSAFELKMWQYRC